MVIKNKTLLMEPFSAQISLFRDVEGAAGQ